MNTKNCGNCFYGSTSGCFDCGPGIDSTLPRWIPVYADMVRGLAKPGQAIIDALTPEKADLWHMATGVGGEAGEVEDCIKKYVVYNKPLDRENLVEELGDLEFYMEHIRQIVGITREETLVANIGKLGKRYVGMTYSDSAAQLRADKT